MQGIGSWLKAICNSAHSSIPHPASLLAWFLLCQLSSRRFLRDLLRRLLGNFRRFLCRRHRLRWRLLWLLLIRCFGRLLFRGCGLLLCLRSSRALRRRRRCDRLRRFRLRLRRTLRQVVLAIRIDLEHQLASRSGRTGCGRLRRPTGAAAIRLPRLCSSERSAPSQARLPA